MVRKLWVGIAIVIIVGIGLGLLISKNSTGCYIPPLTQLSIIGLSGPLTTGMTAFMTVYCDGNCYQTMSSKNIQPDELMATIQIREPSGFTSAVTMVGMTGPTSLVISTPPNRFFGGAATWDIEKALAESGTYTLMIKISKGFDAPFWTENVDFSVAPSYVAPSYVPTPPTPAPSPPVVNTTIKLSENVVVQVPMRCLL